VIMHVLNGSWAEIDKMVWLCIWNMIGWLVINWHEIGMHDYSMIGWW